MGNRLLPVLLIVLAVALLVVALVRDGNNMWIALAGVACALGAGASGVLTRQGIGRE